MIWKWAARILLGWLIKRIVKRRTAKKAAKAAFQAMMPDYDGLAI